MALPILSLERVTVRYGGDAVLKDATLSVQKGEKVAVIGPSGFGKSTLLKTFAGLVRPDEGRMLVEGLDFHAATREKQQEIRARMGMLFQRNALFDSMKNDENIRLALREVTTKAPDEIEKIIDHYLDAVGLSHAKDLFPDEISGGMQKRLGIARAIALEPEIVFYDDPTAGLDPITSRKIIELILKLQAATNSTVVAVTNDMNRAYQLSDRIVMVFPDGIIETGSPEQTKKSRDPRVQQFIHGRAEGPLADRE